MVIGSPSIARSGAALLLASLIVVACGGTAAIAPVTSVTPAPDAPSDAAGASAAGAVLDLCALVTAADVEALYPGTSVTATEPSSSNTTDFGGCGYSFQPEDEGFSMEVVTGDQAMTFWNGNIPPQGDYSIPLSGIGDQAMRGPGEADFVSISGSTFCEIEPGTWITELYDGLATPDANDAVPDASANAIAQKLGTLCNKVFAAQ